MINKNKLVLLSCSTKIRNDRKWICVILFLYILTSCGENYEGRVENTSFIGKKIVPLSATKKKVDEVINPIDMAIFDNYLVFQNEYSENDHWFYVYTKDMDFCFSFAPFGVGPNEFISPRIIKNGSGNIISIFDASSNAIRKYRINIDNVTFLSEYYIDTCDYSVQETAYVNDSIIVQMAISNNGTVLYTSDIIRNKRIDTAFFQTGFKDKMGIDYNPTVDNFRFSINKGRFVAVMHYVNDIITGEIDENGFFSKKEYKVINSNFTPCNEIYDNVFYHAYPAIFEDFLFIPYYGYVFRETAPFPLNLKRRHFDFVIEVYDWNKTPLCVITLDSDFLFLYIDCIEEKMYILDVTIDFDYLLEYDLSVLRKME
ncbi:TolB-like 6-bladed beta-propeller domain-containing protein [Parabacteroides sp. OttesenSCG-928-B22]|nr:TolB-like 6-bladed beta-propeller domain-containing protein [Parabacteroides sp. OttesenSCG-928-B22]